MTQRLPVKPGSFCWVDVAVSDARDTLGFFTDLFGWGRRVRPTSEAEAYSIFTSGGSHIAGLYEVPQDGPSQWMSYALVDDLQESTEKAVSLGAKVVNGPLEISGFGRMTMVQDPVGVVFALWQSERGETTPSGDIGIVSWNELLTDRQEQAREFYTALFDWDCETVHFGDLEYTVFKSGDRQTGGMMAPAEGGRSPSHWLVHFSIADCDETVTRVKELGGSVVVEPIDYEGVGRSAVVADPSGGIFGVIKLLDS